MTSKPVTYESLKSILEHMDVHKRFELVRRCLSIQNASRVTPLRINNLKFERYSGPNMMTINGVKYSTGTVRVYPEGQIGEQWHEEDNERGGVAVDFKQFGFATTDGDRVVGDQIDEDDETVMYTEGYYQQLKIYMDYRRNKRDSYSDNYGIYQMYKQEGCRELLDDIENCMEKLQQFYDNRDKSRVLYKPMSQLTIEYPNGKKMIQRSEKRLNDLEDDLYNQIFGDSKIVYVKCLESNHLYDALRLPFTFKFHIQELILVDCHPDFLDTVQQLIDPSCLPLKKITFHSYPVDGRKPLIRSADYLAFEENNILDIAEIVTLPNRKITICKAYHYELHTYVRQILSWMNEDRPIGAVCSFHIANGNIISRTMEILERDENGTRAGPRCIYIPKDLNSKAKVSYRPLETDPEWVLELEMVTA